jgi:hypothetical protein
MQLCRNFAVYMPIMDEPIVNKVAQSSLHTLDLEQFYPKEEVAVFDLKDYLFMGLILKEKDFREALKQLDVSSYQNKIAALTCSADAIIPVWAYMLVASYLQPVAATIIFGDAHKALGDAMIGNLKTNLNPVSYTDKRVVVKGCGDKPVSEAVYVAVTAMLRPYATSIMYGEPCSTVPVYKKAAAK